MAVLKVTLCQLRTFLIVMYGGASLARTYAQNKNVGIGKQRAAVQQTPLSYVCNSLTAAVPKKPAKPTLAVTELAIRSE